MYILCMYVCMYVCMNDDLDRMNDGQNTRKINKDNE